MTDTEILDFLDEYLDNVTQIPANRDFLRRFVLDIDEMTIRAGSLRQVARQAKAKFDGVNRDE